MYSVWLKGAIMLPGQVNCRIAGGRKKLATFPITEFVATIFELAFLHYPANWAEAQVRMRRWVHMREF